MKQTAWDWRAAGNFAAGGTGGGLAIAAAAAAAISVPPVPQLAFLLAALFVAGGLALVASEVGHPLRFFRVFFHPQTSWMTREALIAPACILALLAAAWFANPELMVPAAVLGAAFLYTQARMLEAARGIPAWREPRIVPLIITTGLAEGSGAFLSLTALISRSIEIAPFVICLLLFRWAAWSGYVERLQNEETPVRGALERFGRQFVFTGTALPILLLLLAIFVPALTQLAAVLAGLATAVYGWMLKLTIVTRAGHTQGFALPHFPT